MEPKNRAISTFHKHITYYSIFWMANRTTPPETGSDPVSVDSRHWKIPKNPRQRSPGLEETVDMSCFNFPNFLDIFPDVCTEIGIYRLSSPPLRSSIEKDLGGLHVTVAILLEVEGQKGESVPWHSTRYTWPRYTRRVASTQCHPSFQQTVFVSNMEVLKTQMMPNVDCNWYLRT